ncbi:MAG: 30S ribosomal protein THX, partial [Bacteroidetes bacterium]|nr:30S ribosomal protein THX [Bacteroidota bacterium]
MGKGDRKTRRGKLFSGSYGVLRPRKRKSEFSVVTATKKKVAEPEKPKAPTPKVAPKLKAEPVAKVVKAEP